ncbi:MAG TPA: presqualene diphosphate synthase HpnD [Acidobacteriota bacterium]|nr:presqualene diphosphate synthase HpnD [Acidobacteriota bacterium]
MDPELAASYRSAEEVARNRARNFYYSFLVLPRPQRRALCAVYAFMRYCDDISDGGAGNEDKGEQLRKWRTQLDLALAGDFGGNPFLRAFHDTVRRFSIPGQYFHWVIDGAEMDLSIESYLTFDELYRYCFNVASAVGLVCLQIFGFREERATKYAEHCGIAFQLTNILRDVREDAQMGRIYLPGEDLERFAYTPEDLRRGVYDGRFRALMAFEADRAREYYRRARNLLPLVDETSRPSLWAMMEIYGRILKKIVRREYNVFGRRIRLSKPEKTGIVMKALAMRYIPGVRIAPPPDAVSEESP